jgi:nucleotide-binding universal stress UspA family protein
MKVLIAVDSSPFVTQILDAVRKRLWSDDTSFFILTVVERTPDWSTQEEYSRQSKMILERNVDYFRKKLPHHKLTSEVLEGTAASEIIGAAHNWGAELIVIGSHGDTGVRKTHVGSVAADVVNKAPCAVEVVKVRRVHNEGNAVAASAKRNHN